MSTRLLPLLAFASLAGPLTAQQADALLSELRAWLARPADERAAHCPTTAVPKASVDAAITAVFEVMRSEAKAQRKAELTRTKVEMRGQPDLLTVTANDREMKVYERTFGDEPESGHSLWISMHGGGGTAARVNDRQWRNQIQLYQPAEGIYVAPRAPTNTWNLWHQGHIDALFDRLIENYVIDRGVDPDRVYLLGYSAGGDGVYKLAPRLADRLAAASMMAGHPNGEPMLGLRNLPFMIWMGANDAAYQRNETAAQWGEQLDELAEDDPGGYVHETHIVAGKGHWMDREDRAAIPWMAKHTRTPWPKKVVWRQGDTVHDRFYWLGMPLAEAERGQLVTAVVDGQTITLTTAHEARLHLRLSDHLLDLDQPITVERNGQRVFQGRVQRSVRAIHDSLRQRLDPKTVACAILEVGP